MSNYYIGNIYAPLPSSSNYSSWATVSYSLDPADASNVVSTQGHLVKNTIRARNEYISYIEPNNLRSGWGGSYTWRSGEMNVNEGPAQNNCAFYVKYKGQWINLKDNTAVEQAGLDSIFERQTISSQSLYHYVVLYVWENSDEDKYRFGYTVKINQNSTLEDFKDSTDEAAIIQFLADINSENTGAYYDSTLGRTSPTFEITEAVEAIWETGTGLLIPGILNYAQYKDTNAQGTQINFPSVKRALTNTPWLGQSYAGRRIDTYFSDETLGTDAVYALKKGCLIGSTTYDTSLWGQSSNAGKRSGVVYRNGNGTYSIVDVSASIADILSSLQNNPTLYDNYRFHGDDAFVMLDVSAGGGGGGAGYYKTLEEGNNGGGGGGGGSCRLVVRLTEGDLLLVEAGAAGQAKQDGWESRVCLLSSYNTVVSGVVCDGGHAGSSATSGSYGGGGNGGAVYWCADDGYSMDTNKPITQENGDNVTNTTVVWDPSVDQSSQTGLVDASRIYVIFAATGGWGGRGGQDAFLGINDVYPQKGWAPLYNNSPLSSIEMITNAFYAIAYTNKSLPGGCTSLSQSGSNAANYRMGGGGGCNFSYWYAAYGGGGASGDGHSGIYGCGGAGGGTGRVGYSGTGKQGGPGFVVVSR